MKKRLRTLFKVAGLVTLLSGLYVSLAMAQVEVPVDIKPGSCPTR